MLDLVIPDVTDELTVAVPVPDMDAVPVFVLAAVAEGVDAAVCESDGDPVVVIVAVAVELCVPETVATAVTEGD